MPKKYIYIFIIIIYIVFVISVLDASVERYKPEFETNFTMGNEEYYVAFFQQNVIWDEADVTCKVYFAHLLSKFSTNSSLYSELQKRGVDFLWAGIRRKADYYIQDTMRSKYELKKLFRSKSEKSSDIIGEKWRDSDNLMYDCVVLSLRDGMLGTKNCSDRYPFVCDSIQSFRENKEGCPETWYLSPALSITGRKCILESQRDLPYSEAENSCRQNQSRLASKYEYGILVERQQLHSQKDVQEYWARKEDDSSCPYQLFKNENRSHEHPSCSKHLPFVCVRSVETESLDVIIEVGSSKMSVDPCQIFPWNSTCNISHKIICSTKNHPLWSDPQFQWYIDDIPVHISSYVLDLNLLIKSFKSSERNRNSECTKQGSYHCEVRFPGSVRTYRSEKIDFFYPDIATYVIDIHGIGRDNYTDYSHSVFQNQMNKYDAVINKILRQENAAWDFKSIRWTGESCSMKLVLFVNRSHNYNDETAYKKIEKDFKENSSLFRLGDNILLTVHSADVCFHSDLNPNDACSEIEWPTTIQVKNVLTERACLNENKKFVHRECKGSTVYKAVWSSFDCSVCKDFRERYQDKTVQCPDGYEKFKNQDLCFKVYREPKNWLDAYKTCSNLSSYLVDVPHETDIGSVNRLWLSYKYSHGHIQGFGQKPINLKTLYEKEEMLLKNLNKKSHELHCISAVREKSGFEFKFENCSMEMSFVCVQELYDISSVKFGSNEIKLYKQKNMESCYYLENSPFSWMDAVNFCEQTGAKLLSGIQDTKSYSYLKKFIIDQYSNETECDAITWWMDLEDVIQNGMPSDLKYVDWGPSSNFNITDPHGVITLFPDKKIYWSLENSHKKLGVICELQDCHDSRSTGAYIEKRSYFEINGNEGALDWLKAFYFKCIPSGLYIANSISWYKDDIFLGIASDVLDFHNISIMSDLEALEFQGYYSCSVDRVDKREMVFSSKQLIRVPEFSTIVISMKSDEEGYLFDCPKYILSKELKEKTTLYKCFNDHWKTSLNFNEFHFHLKNLICHSSYIDITVHVHFKKENIVEKEMMQKVNFSNFCKACNIDPESITVRSAAFCYGDEVHLENYILRWPTTELGQSSFPEKMCLTSEHALIERKCMGDFNSGAFWSNISITKCHETDYPITEELFYVSKSENIMDSLHRVPELTSNPESLQPSDVQITADILRSLAESEKPFPSDNLYEVVKTVSNIIDVDQEVISVVANSSNRIIGFLERIASNIDEVTHKRNYSTKNVIVNVYPLNSNESDVPNGISVSNFITSSIFNASVEDLESNMQKFEAGVVVPKSLIQETSNVSNQLAYIVNKNVNYQENISVLSDVVTVAFHNKNVYDLKENISLLFKLNLSKITPINIQQEVKCAFWDADLNAWSYRGCFLKNVSKNSVLCGCNHLTSFTVIMTKSPPPTHESALNYITYIGCSLSCVGLGMIILTFLCFREWRKSLKNKCLFNYSLSHVLFLIIFMVGIEQTSSKDWCKAIAVFLHYFLLSSFSWMIVLAYTVYLSLVKVFATYTACLIQKAMVFAWGIPAIIVIAILSNNPEHYPADKLCLLSQDASLYGITIPLILMLIINYMIFLTILYLNTCGKQYIACNQSKRKVLLTRTKALLITSVLLGLSWIFGFFMMGTQGDSEIIYMYLFAITTTFQGFLLAVFFIFLPDVTCQRWIRLVTLRKVVFKPLSTPAHSSYVTNHVTKQV